MCHVQIQIHQFWLNIISQFLLFMMAQCKVQPVMSDGFLISWKPLPQCSG